MFCQGWEYILQRGLLQVRKIKVNHARLALSLICSLCHTRTQPRTPTNHAHGGPLQLLALWENPFETFKGTGVFFSYLILFLFFLTKTLWHSHC